MNPVNGLKMTVFPIYKEKPMEKMTTFGTGATRSSDEGKLDYEGYFSPLVLKRRAEYMLKHQYQADGQKRTSDNWQNGMDLARYIKSKFRHFMDMFLIHRGFPEEAENNDIEEAICADMFNAEGYLHELLKAKKEPK